MSEAPCVYVRERERERHIGWQEIRVYVYVLSERECVCVYVCDIGWQGVCVYVIERMREWKSVCVCGIWGRDWDEKNKDKINF